MKRDITEIFKKYKTDKNDHGYAEYYQKHLPETATKILEVGVHEGESCKLWHEIYPDAKIYGLDLFTNGIPFNESWCTWFKGSQIDGELLKNIRTYGPFDFITEDASHNSRDQLITFYSLVDCAPLYIVEDLHCCKEEFYRQGMRFKNTMLAQLEREDDNPITSWQFHLYNSKIAFIYAD